MNLIDTGRTKIVRDRSKPLEEGQVYADDSRTAHLKQHFKKGGFASSYFFGLLSQTWKEIAQEDRRTPYPFSDARAEYLRVALQRKTGICMDFSYSASSASSLSSSSVFPTVSLKHTAEAFAKHHLIPSLVQGSRDSYVTRDAIFSAHKSVFGPLPDTYRGEFFKIVGKVFEQHHGLGSWDAVQGQITVPGGGRPRVVRMALDKARFQRCLEIRSAVAGTIALGRHEWRLPVQIRRKIISFCFE